jgi:hypothetical protein
MKKRAMKEQGNLITECLVETLTILSHKGIIDVATATDYIKDRNLKGLQ